MQDVAEKSSNSNLKSPGPPRIAPSGLVAFWAPKLTQIGLQCLSLRLATSYAIFSAGEPDFQHFFQFLTFPTSKIKLSGEKFVIFDLFALFASDAVCDVSWGPFRTVGGSPGTLLAGSLELFGVSCGPLGGLFRPVCVLWVFFCDALGPRMRLRGLQEASGAAPQALQRPPGGIKKASPSLKSRFLLLCAKGVARDAPQALSIIFGEGSLKTKCS